MKVFLNTIILLGAVQGFIICILLFRRSIPKLSNRLLAFLILFMSMASINLYFFNTGFFESTQALRIISYVVPLVIIMPMGPLIYFYIQSMLDPSFRLIRFHKLQFYTAIIDIVPELSAIIFIIGVYARLLVPNPYPWGEFIDTYNVYADIPRWLSVTIYVVLSYRYIKRMRKAGVNPDKAGLIKWLQQFITVFLVFQVIWMIYLVPYIIPAYSNKLLNWVDWYPIYIPLAIMIYWLGIKGYLVTYSIAEKKKKGLSQELPASLIEQTTMLLKKSMEEDKLYLNPALNLDTVSAHTGVAAKTISAVLNQHLHKNFTEWVNGFRVEEFKQKIRQGDLERLTISAIASECGFNSQATFQRIFKQSVGMTPSEFLKSEVF